MTGKTKNPVGKMIRHGAKKIVGVADAATNVASNAARKGAKVFQKSVSLDRSMIYTDEAEDAVLASVEERAKDTKVGEDGFRPAVKGELPPLRVPNIGIMGDATGTLHASSRRSSLSIQHRLDIAALRQQRQSGVNSSFRAGHQRAHTLLEDIDKGIEFSKSFGFAHLDDIDKPFRDLDNSSVSSDNERRTLSTEKEDTYPDEGLPLLSDSRMTSERRLKARQVLEKSAWKAKDLIDPTVFIQDLSNWFLQSTFIVAIPCFVVSFVLFYLCGNPTTPDYLHQITLCWWFDFMGRQLVTLELARITQTIFMRLLLTSKVITSTLGPWLTIYFIQSKGWPFVLTSWGSWDLILLEGNSKFENHWFYFTGLRIFVEGNSGDFILSSGYYQRILFSMILTGVLASVKSTVVTLYFGRQMVATYKPKLEEILKDIITVTDVAELAIESDKIADVIGIDSADKGSAKNSRESLEAMRMARRRGRSSMIRWSDIRFQPDNKSSNNSESSEDLSLAASDDGDSRKIDFEFDPEEDGDFFKPKKPNIYGSSVGSRFGMKSLLDKWDEPELKGAKREFLLQSYNVSVDSIMKFRQALRYMNLDYPFSEAFGLASTRNEMISSAEAVYKRLMKLSSDPDALNFSAFDVLIFNEDGSEDESKKKSLVNMFHPDPDGGIQIISFVQACDTLYRRLRLFRASVGNSSVIDVAGSFAFGSTCAKAFEGVMLIIGRRPFGIGDRITIEDSAGADVPTMSKSWIVEDISLLCTTLRYGSSNEIAQVSNGSIANARITNCNRSEKATVHILLHFHMSCHEGTRTMDMFKEGVEDYIRENRNTWDSIFFFRCESINPNNEEVTYRLAVRSIHTWQVSNRVFRHRGELHQFCIALSFKLRINYDAPNDRSIMYYGGSLENGGVEDYKSRILKNSNIVNQEDENFDENMLSSSLSLKPWKQESVKHLDRRKKQTEGAGKISESRMERNLETKNNVDGNVRDFKSSDNEPWNDDDKAFLSMPQGDDRNIGHSTSADDQSWNDDDRAFLNMLKGSQT